MTLFRNLPVTVSTFILGVLGLVFIYYTFKVPKEGKLIVGSFVFLTFGITILSLLKLYTKVIFSFERMFGVILLIFIFLALMGVIIKLIVIKKRRMRFP
jgi:hypothetical protein